MTSWPTWGCGVSSFPWTYDELETCLLLEGDGSVTPDGGEPVPFGAQAARATGAVVMTKDRDVIRLLEGPTLR